MFYIQERSKGFTHHSFRKWLCLLAIMLSGSRFSLANPIPNSNPILSNGNQVRVLYLYTDNKHMHQFLQITSDGKVTGTEIKNQYGVFEIKAVEAGIVVIKGIESLRYLCMDSAHKLYGSEVYDINDCSFNEVITSENYNVYFSEKHSEKLSLTPEKGGQMTNFLPMDAFFGVFDDRHDDTINFNSFDPLKMHRDVFVSNPNRK